MMGKYHISEFSRDISIQKVVFNEKIRKVFQPYSVDFNSLCVRFCFCGVRQSVHKFRRVRKSYLRLYGREYR